MPPVRIMKVIPMETMPTVVACQNRFPMFPGVRKREVTMLRAVQSRKNAASIAQLHTVLGPKILERLRCPVSVRVRHVVRFLMRSGIG
jgi:hypothetical protein